MVDKLSVAMRSKIMRSIRSKDTKPELIVRKLLTGLGYRYRLHKKGLPGRPDIVFIGRKKAIFVHGCFWHGHQNCKIGHMPESPAWQQKLMRNIERDAQNMDALNELGWKCLIIWECELVDLDRCSALLIDFIGPTKANP